MLNLASFPRPPIHNDGPHRFSIDLVDLLFGAVAINLVMLQWALTILPSVFFLYVAIHNAYSTNMKLTPAAAVLVADTIGVLMLGGWACRWAAKGFVTSSYWRMVPATFGFLAYSAFMIWAGHIDGYVCLAVIVFMTSAFARLRLLKRTSHG